MRRFLTNVDETDRPKFLNGDRKLEKTISQKKPLKPGSLVLLFATANATLKELTN